MRGISVMSNLSKHMIAVRNMVVVAYFQSSSSHNRLIFTDCFFLLLLAGFSRLTPETDFLSRKGKTVYLSSKVARLISVSDCQFFAVAHSTTLCDPISSRSRRVTGGRFLNLA